jgi:hypothetical protein
MGQIVHPPPRLLDRTTRLRYEFVYVVVQAVVYAVDLA